MKLFKTSLVAIVGLGLVTGCAGSEFGALSSDEQALREMAILEPIEEGIPVEAPATKLAVSAEEKEELLSNDLIANAYESAPADEQEMLLYSYSVAIRCPEQTATFQQLTQQGVPEAEIQVMSLIEQCPSISDDELSLIGEEIDPNGTGGVQPTNKSAKKIIYNIGKAALWGYFFHAAAQTEWDGFL